MNRARLGLAHAAADEMKKIMKNYDDDDEDYTLWWARIFSIL